MPHDYMPGDHRRDEFIWVLIAVFDTPWGYIKKPEFHAAAEAYVKLLEERGISDLMIFFDIVTDVSRQVEDAILSALHYGVLGWGDMNRGKYPVHTSPEHMRRVLTPRSDLVSEDRILPEEMEIAFVAAEEIRDKVISGEIRPKFQILQT